MAHISRALHAALLVLAWPLTSLAAPVASAPAKATGSREPSAAVETPARSSVDTRDAGPPLLFDRRVPVGIYGGLDVAYTRMFGQDGAVVGVQGALVLDHRFSLGLAGYGWTNAQPGPNDAAGQAQKFETGYGGATLRYSFFIPGAPVYFTVGTLVGGGAIVLTPEDHDDFGDSDSNESEDMFALVQPDVTLHANLTHWMRFGLTAGYRLTAGVDRMGFDESDVNGVLVGGHVQFGRF